MSYASMGAFGNGVGISCARMQTEMPGTGTYMPGQICGEYPGKTGHHPPRPRICGGAGIMDVQNGLKLAGMYQGPIDGHVNAGFTAVIGAIAAAYNVPWDGNAFTIGPNLCGAIIAEVSKGAPSCTSGYDKSYELNCVAKPSGPLMEPLPDSAPPPPPPPPTGGSKITIGRSAFRRVAAAPKVNILASRDALRRVASTTEADVSAEPVPEDTLAPVPEVAEGIPTWAYVAGGAVVLGGVAYFVLR